MLKAERRSDEVEDLMIWVSELKSHSILFLGVFEDLIQILTILHNDLGNGSGCLCAEYGPSNRRPLGLVDAASVVHQGGEGVRQHHLQMVLVDSLAKDDGDGDGDDNYCEEKSAESKSTLVHHAVGCQRLQHWFRRPWGENL